MPVTADLIPLGRFYNLILTIFSRPEGVIQVELCIRERELATFS